MRFCFKLPSCSRTVFNAFFRFDMHSASMKNWIRSALQVYAWSVTNLERETKICKLLKQCRTFSMPFTHALTIVSFPRLTVVISIKWKLASGMRGKTKSTPDSVNIYIFPFSGNHIVRFRWFCEQPYFVVAMFFLLFIYHIYGCNWYDLKDADTHPHNQWLPFINT